MLHPLQKQNNNVDFTSVMLISAKTIITDKTHPTKPSIIIVVRDQNILSRQRFTSCLF